MSNPTPISQHKPSTSNEDGQPLTQKDLLENIPLIITNAKPVKTFWIIEATRTDTGEAVVFSGSKVINDVMAHVTAKKAFPVSAILVKVPGDNPQGYYWDIQDPPNTQAPANGSVQPSGRIAEVGAFVDRKVVTPQQVQDMVAEIAGGPTKVAALSDDQYALLLSALRDLESDPPLEPAPF